MQDRHRHSQRVAAARAGFSERTAIDADPRLPSQRQPERGRTVPDPLEAVWEPGLLPILQRDASVQAVTLLRPPLYGNGPRPIGSERYPKPPLPGA